MGQYLFELFATIAPPNFGADLKDSAHKKTLTKGTLYAKKTLKFQHNGQENTYLKIGQNHQKWTPNRKISGKIKPNQSATAQISTPHLTQNTPKQGIPLQNSNIIENSNLNKQI